MKISKFIHSSPIVPAVLVGQSFRSQIEDELGILKLNFNDGLVLVAIFFENRPCRPSELADHLQLSRSQISQSLKRLESAELVSRALEKSDGRFLNLRLTASGRTKSQKVIKIFDVLTRKVDAVLGEDVAARTAGQLLKLI